MNQSGVSFTSYIGLLIAMCIGAIGSWLLRPSITNGGEIVTFSPAVEPAESAKHFTCPMTSTDVVDFTYTPGVASSFSLQAAFYEYVMSLDIPTIERLLQAANGALVGRDYAWATTMLLARYTELDPIQAIQEVEASSYHLEKYWFNQVFASYGFMNTPAALQQASKLPEPRRREAHAAILSGVQHLSLAERQKFADQTDVQPAINLSGRDPRLVWQEVSAIADEKMRSSALHALAKGIAQKQPMLALELAADLATSSEKEDNSVVDGILKQLAKTDASAALNWLQSQPEGIAEPQQQLSILKSLASQDVALAVEAIEQFSIEERTNAIGTVGLAWAQQDPNSAANWLSKQGLEDDSQGLYFRSIGRALGKQGLSFVETWQDELPREVSSPALSAALQTEAELNPARAIEFIDNQVEPATRVKLAQDVISFLSSKDPNLAASWIERVDLEKNDRAALYGSLASVWAMQDNEAAYAFALDIENPTLRDSALVGWSSVKESSTQRIEDIYERMEQPIQKLQVASVLHNRIAASDPVRAAELRSNGKLSSQGGVDGELLQRCLADAIGSE